MIMDLLLRALTMELGGAALLQRYNGSVASMMMTMYPQHAWNESMFGNEQWKKQQERKRALTELWSKYNSESNDGEQTTSIVDMLSKGSAYMTKLPGEMHEAIRTRVDQHVSSAESLLVAKVTKDRYKERNSESQSKNNSLARGEKRGVKRSKQLEKPCESFPQSRRVCVWLCGLCFMYGCDGTQTSCKR